MAVHHVKRPSAPKLIADDRQPHTCVTRSDTATSGPSSKAQRDLARAKRSAPSQPSRVWRRPDPEHQVAVQLKTSPVVIEQAAERALIARPARTSRVQSSPVG